MMRLLFIVLFATTSLLATPLELKTFTIAIPQMERTAYTPPTQSVTFVGVFYPKDQPTITAQSQYPAGSPFYLLAQLLDSYAKGDLQQAATLYTAASQPILRASIEENGEERILEVGQNITSLHPRILWIDSPGRIICHAELNNNGSSLPFVLTYEQGTWKLVAGLMSSPFSNVLSYVSMYRRWGALKVSEITAQAPVGAAIAITDKAFDRFPILFPEPEPLPASLSAPSPAAPARHN